MARRVPPPHDRARACGSVGCVTAGAWLGPSSSAVPPRTRSAPAARARRATPATRRRRAAPAPRAWPTPPRRPPQLELAGAASRSISACSVVPASDGTSRPARSWRSLALGQAGTVFGLGGRGGELSCYRCATGGVWCAEKRNEDGALAVGIRGLKSWIVRSSIARRSGRLPRRRDGHRASTGASSSAVTVIAQAALSERSAHDRGWWSRVTTAQAVQALQPALATI
jgi:hypothetical protein